MYSTSPGQKNQRNTNRVQWAMVFILQILVLCGKQVFFLHEIKSIFKQLLAITKEVHSTKAECCLKVSIYSIGSAI